MPPGRSPTGPRVGPRRRRPRPWCRSGPRPRASSRRSRRTARACRARRRARTARRRRACRGGRSPPSGTSRRARRGGGSAPPRPRRPPGPSCRLDLLGRELLAPPLGRRARREVAERLALAVRGLVEREDPQQGLVELPVRHLLEHDLAEARVGPAAAPRAPLSGPPPRGGGGGGRGPPRGGSPPPPTPPPSPFFPPPWPPGGG